MNTAAPYAHDRIPPQSLEMEQAVLGCMLIERTAIEIAEEILKPDDFYRDAHKLLFQTILAVHHRREPVDLLTLRAELEKLEKLDSIGGWPYLVQLPDSVPSAANTEAYCQVVGEKATLRRILAASGELYALAHCEYDDIKNVVDRVEQSVRSVATHGDLKSSFHGMSELMLAMNDELEMRQQHGGQLTGIPSGLREMDYMTSGLQPGDLVIVAGRPSMGKTAFALGIGEHIACEVKKPVALFSLEMAKEQLCYRLIASGARVPVHHLRQARLDHGGWSRVGQSCARLSDSSLWINDQSDIDIHQIRSKSRRFQSEVGLGLVIIDYLQLIHYGVSSSGVDQIGEIAKGLKQLARELAVPVIALSQLSRAVEQRPDKRPMLSDLRGSGNIEAEADVVVFPFRPEYYKSKEETSATKDKQEYAERTARGEVKTEEAEISIAKQRNGPTGRVKVAFQPEFARFVNLAGPMNERMAL